MLYMLGIVFGFGGTVMFFDISDKIDKSQPVPNAEIIMVIIAMIVCPICFIASKWLENEDD